MTHQQESARIPNSNPWVRPDQKTFFQLDDLAPDVAKRYKQLQRGKGAETKDVTLTIELVLNRREVNAKAVEKSGKYSFDKFYETDELLGLSYQELQAYTGQLSNKDLTQLYGADNKSIRAVEEFLKRSGATNIDTSTAREQRSLSFEITSENFFEVFTNGKLEFNYDGTFDYISSNGTSKSFLKAQGEGAKAFADAILGIKILNKQRTPEDSATTRPPSNNINLFPLEIAEEYNFPGISNNDAGEGARIGLVGSGGNQAMLNWHGSQNYNNYLSSQGRDPSRTPDFISTDEQYPDTGDTGEQMLDVSILTSVAPGAQLIASAANSMYQRYADLIYLDEPVDVISSSVGLKAFVNSDSKAFDELCMDAALRGITTVIASGDAGTLNLMEPDLQVLRPNNSYANKKTNLSILTSGPAASLSVGGTALGVTAGEDGKETLTAETQTTWNQFPTAEPIDSEYSAIYPEGFSEAQLNLPAVTLFNANDGLWQGIGSSGIINKSSGLYGATYQRKNLTGEWEDTWRSYPDISMLSGGNTSNITEQFYVHSDFDSITGSYNLYSSEGTSAAAPLTAALLAIAASEMKKLHGEEARIGFINPLLYELYNSDALSAVFFDVPAGSNNANIYYYPKSPEEWDGLYMSYVINKKASTVTYIPLNGTGPNGELDLNYSSTGPGFDAATGLGSLNGQGFLNQLLAAYASL